MKTTGIIQSNIHRILSADSQIITWYTYNLDKFSIRLTSIYSKKTRPLFLTYRKPHPLREKIGTESEVNLISPSFYI